MDMAASGTDDMASNIDGDSDIAAFDTDLPAEHNVCKNSCFFFSFKLYLLNVWSL